MKSNILRSIASGVACLLAAAACNPLDIVQDSKLSASNMWTSASDVTTSTNGIYYLMRSNFVDASTNMFYWGEARVGSYMWGPSLFYNIHDADMSAIVKNVMDQSTDGTSWSAIYTAIDQANSVIKYAPQVSGMTEKDFGFAMGQAHFARAYLYFWVARVWGDAPLNLVPVESTTQPECYPEKASKADIYASIGSDIETALSYADYLGTNKYLGTKDAVNMLKAEWALWMYSAQNGGDSYLTLAEEALKAIGISGTRLLADYASIFSIGNKVNSEVVFALNNNQTEKLTGGYYSMFTFPTGAAANQYCQNPVPIYQTQWWSYSQNFVDKLLASKEKGDKRVDCNLGIGEYGVNGEVLSWPNKFLGDMSSSTCIFDCDLLYYRYAQAVMMDAELKYYKKDYAGAVASLNLIAQRAYGKDLDIQATGEEVLNALVDEYFLEFPCEGVIWWALIRLNRIEDINPAIKEYKATNPNILLWPISKSALNRNYKLRQTEGWS